MRQARLFVDELHQGPLVLDADRAHYVKNVLRLQLGDEVLLLGGGKVALGRVVTLEGEARLEVLEPREAPPLDCELTVAVAAPKGDRADWLVEKLTELGVTRIVWMKTERTVVVPKASGNKQERFSRLAEAAARQAGRARPPELSGPSELDEILALPTSARFIGDAGGEPLRDALATQPASAVLAIGPEGGFTAAELLRAQKNGYTAVRFAPFTLRVETAAVAGAAVILSGTSPAGARKVVKQS